MTWALLTLSTKMGDSTLLKLCADLIQRLRDEKTLELAVQEVIEGAQVNIVGKLSSDQFYQYTLFNALFEMYNAGIKIQHAATDNKRPDALLPRHFKGLSYTKASKQTLAADKFASNAAPLIEKLRAEGYTTLEAVSQRLNQLGYPRPRGGKWHPKTVRAIEARIQKKRELLENLGLL